MLERGWFDQYGSNETTAPRGPPAEGDLDEFDDFFTPPPPPPPPKRRATTLLTTTQQPPATVSALLEELVRAVQMDASDVDVPQWVPPPLPPLPPPPSTTPVADATARLRTSPFASAAVAAAAAAAAPTTEQTSSASSESEGESDAYKDDDEDEEERERQSAGEDEVDDGGRTPERLPGFAPHDDELCARATERTGDHRWDFKQNFAGAGAAERCVGASSIVLRAFAAGGYSAVTSTASHRAQRRLSGADPAALYAEAQRRKRHADSLARGTEGDASELAETQLRTALAFLEIVAVRELQQQQTGGAASSSTGGHRLSEFCTQCAQLFAFYAKASVNSFPAHSAFFTRLRAIAHARRYRSHRDAMKQVLNDVRSSSSGTRQPSPTSGAASAVHSPSSNVHPLLQLSNSQAASLSWLLTSLDDVFMASEYWRNAERRHAPVVPPSFVGTLELASIFDIVDWASDEIEKLIATTSPTPR